MKISPNWIRDFVSPPADDRKMAEELTATGTAIEGSSAKAKTLSYEAEVTTNRVDAMNHFGIAREVSAIYDVDLKPVTPKLVGEQAVSKFKIEIEDAQGCARYTARIVRGVRSGPSPEHIVHRLELIDQRSICNVADATNYVLNELGQPTHAFDLDKLDGGKIVVRRAREGELLKTLDGVERKLTEQDLVIADARQGGSSGRSDGRLRHHDHRADAQRADRVGLVRPGLHSPHLAPSGDAHRRLASLRARSRLRQHAAGLRPRGRAGAADSRRQGRAGDRRRGARGRASANRAAAQRGAENS